MEILLYFLIISSFWGANIVNISLGEVHLTFFRLLLIILVVLLIIFKGNKFIIFNKGNRYSIVFITLWLIWGIFSFYWSIDIKNWLRNIYFIFIGLITIIIMNNIVCDKETLIKCIYAYQCGLIIQILIGWYEIFTKNYCFATVNNAFINYYILRDHRIPIAMCGNPNNFATLMFIGVFISYTCIKNSRMIIFKALNTCAFISSIILIYQTESRANIIGLIMSLLFIVIIGKKATWKSICLKSITLCVAGLYLGYRALGKIKDMLIIGTNSDIVRINLLKNGLYFLKDTFGLGVGAGQIESWISLKSVYDTQGILNMHNWWGEILVAYGTIIFVGYLLFYLKLFNDNLQRYRISTIPEFKSVMLAICAILIGFSIASVSSSSNSTSESLWVFWSICIVWQGVIKRQTVYGGLSKCLE